MKKSVFYVMVIALSLCTFATPVMATERNPAIESSVPEEMPPEVRIMLDRLHEIKEMDKSELTRIEKKELRKEARAIKAALRTTGNGIYLSVGALLVIIIIILLV
jgi:hypothetical protein